MSNYLSKVEILTIIEYLLIGLPNERPGGLMLSIIYGIGCGSFAFALGIVYAIISKLNPLVSSFLQIIISLFRGIPILLMIFFMANLSGFPPHIAGAIALTLYSTSHQGEYLRSFWCAYPIHLHEQSLIMGIHPLSDVLQLKLVWIINKAWNAIITHWISLFKDTGALIIIGIGELTSVSKYLSEATYNLTDWLSVLIIASLMYFCTTLSLVWVLKIFRPKES